MEIPIFIKSGHRVRFRDPADKFDATGFGITVTGSYLPLTGGALSGNLAMGTNNITSVGSITSSKKIIWGTSTFSAGQGQIFNTAADGTVLVGKTGSIYDFVLANCNGTTIFSVPTGTVNVEFAGTIKIKGATSGYVGFIAAAEAGSIVYTLPSADGTTGQVLKTNGSGVLSWSSGSTVYPGSGIAVSNGTGWATSITDNHANWDNAYGWGNHASAGYVTGTPWTGLYLPLSGGTLTGNISLTNKYIEYDNGSYVNCGRIYGIHSGETDYLYIDGSSVNVTGTLYQNLNAVATQTWVGNQGYVTGTPWTSCGYLTAVPTNFTNNSITTMSITVGANAEGHIAGTITLLDGTSSQITFGYTEVLHWNTAYGWGNHASAGYVTGTPWTSCGYLTAVPTNFTNNSITTMSIMVGANAEGHIAGTITLLDGTSSQITFGYTEVLHWNTAYGWGNHASAGYVTGTPWTGCGYVTAGTTLAHYGITDVSLGSLTGVAVYTAAESGGAVTQQLYARAIDIGGVSCYVLTIS